jgi:hypothetical protein
MSEIDLPLHWRVIAFTHCLRKNKALKHPSIPQSHYQAMSILDELFRAMLKELMTGKLSN